MGYSRLFRLMHAILSSVSTNSSDFQVIGCCLVTFVCCYSISEMRKRLNYDLRSTSIFPQCEMTVLLSPVVNYANTNLNTKEWVNVLPKQYNLIKIWMKPCVRRIKSCTIKYLYQTRCYADMMKFLCDSLVIFDVLKKFVSVLGTNLHPHYVLTSVSTYSYLHIAIFYI